jgi:cell fate regulator YaaT (PSP1 superfamily)
MIDVVSISFNDKGKTYFFSPNNLELKNNLTVIVETERGLQFGKVEGEIHQIHENKLTSPLKLVIRIASKADYDQNKKNIKDSKEALKKCKELVEKEKLNMQVIDATYTFDRSQLVFRFISDNRVDFRNLAKELAGLYKTRIELRQVGVRDKAREVGGIGPCGKCFCCSKFLNNFDSVSINMAKNQGIALNPSKINGVCGRLLCCLKYEDENYKEAKKKFPTIGSRVKTPEGEGSVVTLNVLNGTYLVYVAEKGPIEMRINDKG